MGVGMEVRRDGLFWWENNKRNFFQMQSSFPNTQFVSFGSPPPHTHTIQTTVFHEEQRELGAGGEWGPSGSQHNEHKRAPDQEHKHPHKATWL